MNDVTNVAPAADAPTFAPALPPDTGAISTQDAAKIISEARAKAQQPAEPDKPARERAPDGKFVAKESPLEGADASPDEPVPGETVDADPAELPPIEPPRSWPTEDKAWFADLPRDKQERIAERERLRDQDFSRRQNEATEKSKALEAKEQAAEQARQQYESGTQNALQLAYQQLYANFPELKSSEEMTKLAETDPFRAIAAREAEKGFAEKVQKFEWEQQQWRQNESKKFEAWAKEQDDKFLKSHPEFSDPEKGPKARESVKSYLTKQIGIPEDALPKLWNNPLFRDAYTQEIIWDGVQWRAAQAKAKAAVAVPKPQVQKPGAAAPRGSQHAEALTAAQDRLKNARGIEAINAGAAAIAAKRAASARR